MRARTKGSKWVAVTLRLPPSLINALRGDFMAALVARAQDAGFGEVCINDAYIYALRAGLKSLDVEEIVDEEEGVAAGRGVFLLEEE